MEWKDEEFSSFLTLHFGLSLELKHDGPNEYSGHLNGKEIQLESLNRNDAKKELIEKFLLVIDNLKCQSTIVKNNSIIGDVM